MQDPLADTADQKLMHRTFPVRTNDNHIDIQFGCFLEYHFHGWSMHKQGGRFQAVLAQSICNLLDLGKALLSLLLVVAAAHVRVVKRRTRFVLA